MTEHAPPPGLSLSQEILHSLEGAGRLFLFDAQGMRLFTLSVGGFWRSFLAAPIAAPVFVAGLLISDPLLHALPLDFTPAPLPARLTAEALAYPLRWALFPVLMIGLARLLHVTGRYVPYIIAYNWSSVLASLVGLLPLVFYAMRLVDPLTAAIAVQGIQLVVWIYLWFIARTALGIGWVTAIAIVLIDVLSTNLFDHGLAFLLGEQAGSQAAP